MGMKFRMATLLVLVTLFVSGFAQAQSQDTPEKSDPQSLIQIAINVTSNAQHQNLDGYLAIYVDPEKWTAGLKDGDLGQFLIEASDISAGYKAVTKEMLKETGKEFHFEPSEISTDDGEPLPAYLITSATKKPAN